MRFALLSQDLRHLLRSSLFESLLHAGIDDLVFIRISSGHAVAAHRSRDMLILLAELLCLRLDLQQTRRVVL